MREKICLAVALGVILIVVLYAASCSRQVAQTQTVPVPTAEPEVRNAPEISEGNDELAELFEEDRIQAQEAAARDADEKGFVNENIHFAFDSALLSDRAQQILNSKADYLRTNPDIMITIEGHCDDRGTDAYNIALGERRAESVKSFLVDLGIGTNRLNTVSYGEDRPIAIGHDEDSWAENRRAQFVIN
jgi:peptidoglycan-associated lipoprotein